MRLHARRYLYFAKVYLLEVIRALQRRSKRIWERALSRKSSGQQGDASRKTRFFSIVVEVENNPDLIEVMEVPPVLAATLELPDGCRLQTCFEIPPEYAKIVSEM
jgi:hypothetical protein